MTLSDALSKEAQSRNRDLKLVFEGGRVTLPAKLGGTLQQPTCSRYQRRPPARGPQQVGAEVDKAKKKGTDELQRQLDRLLKP